ncbi:c-type cytochrome [Microvirga roseola]|uniref:c-type cytochrome n=1 Tax=Microvirga roseola TaxID=2883126 RepID=UPI001E5856AC|nr:cytochrome c [Microvirga roseola]
MADDRNREKGRGRKLTGLGIGTGALSVLAIAGIIGLVVVYSGAYNVAATEEHASFTRWAFDTTFHNSVESRADDIAAPAEFTPAMVAAGAGPYKAMCQHCHAGPGVERAEWASGTRPRPPHLSEAAARWEPEEVFWIVRHGVKMSGMPAFGPSHDDQAIWNIVAFVKQLPAMAPERYAALGSAGGHGGGGTMAANRRPPGLMAAGCKVRRPQMPVRMASIHTDFGAGISWACPTGASPR